MAHIWEITTCSFSKIGWTRGPVSQESGNVSGLFRGPTIPFISLPRRVSKPLNFATLSIFLTFKRCWKISFSKQADFSLTTGFSSRIVLGTFEKQAPATVCDLYSVAILTERDLVNQEMFPNKMISLVVFTSSLLSTLLKSLLHRKARSVLSSFCRRNTVVRNNYLINCRQVSFDDLRSLQRKAGLQGRNSESSG